MKTDTKGDIGFMEAMAGTMTVCLVLLMFVGYVAADISAEQERQAHFDWSSLEQIHIEDGLLILDNPEILGNCMDSSSIKGIKLTVTVGCLENIEPIKLSFGTSTYDFSKESRIISVTDDCGRTVTAIAEVMVFY